MNITHDNQKLRWFGAMAGIDRREVEKGLNAPVFVYDDIKKLKQDEMEWLEEQHVLNLSGDSDKGISFILWGPYPEYRIVSESRLGGWLQVWHSKIGVGWIRYFRIKKATMHNNYLLPRGAEVWIYCRPVTKASGPVGSLRTFLTPEGRLKATTDPNKRIVGADYRVMVADKWISNEGLRQLVQDDITISRGGEAESEGIMGALGEAWGTVALFVGHLALPGTSVLEVRPPKEGNEHKTVQWHLSRRHYVVLSQRQAQRLSKERRGPTDHEIRRAAGWRRAHFRLLTSAVFTKKRGERVPVKHAWVGPREWKGHDGKVYKVIDIERKEDNENIRNIHTGRDTGRDSGP